MTYTPTLFTFGTVGGTPVQGDIACAGTLQGTSTGGLTAAYVTLTATYVMLDTGSVITRPFQDGAAPSVQLLPQTFSSGTTLLLHVPEANALISAGFATLVKYV
jgi:hypothetical protein